MCLLEDRAGPLTKLTATTPSNTAVNRELERIPESPFPPSVAPTLSLRRLISVNLFTRN